MAGTIAKATENRAAAKETRSIKDWVNVYKGEVAKALPKVLTPERFTRMVTTAITITPKLQDCTPESFIGSMLEAAQLGLEPNTPLGQAYLIPYGNKCQFQIGYKGMMDLAYRSGEIKNIEAHVVYENDEFEFEYGLNSNLKHVPTLEEKGKAIWVYAIYRLNNGGYGFEVMSYNECLQHGKKYSKTYNNGPWKTNPEEMAKKTMIKKVLKYAPMKSDFIIADEREIVFNPEDSTLKIDTMFNENNEEDRKEETENTYIEVDPNTGEIIG